MEFGVFLPVSGRASSREGLMDAVQKAEVFGFTSVWAADRIIIPWNIDTHYAYNWSGSFFVPPEKPFLEPLTALAFLAGCTERVKLGVSVLVMTYRDPVYWAKVAATIDWLSKGRFILGVGIGWMQEEFAALGRAEIFKERAKVGEEQLQVVRNLFSEEHCTFHGRYYDYEDIAFQPKAYDERSPIPLWMGGEGKGAQRRAGRHADAWFPYFPRVTAAELRSRYENVRRHAADAGRDPDSVRLNCCLPLEITDRPAEQEDDVLRGTPEQIAEGLGRFRDVGVEHVALQFLVGRYPERVEQMQRFSEEILQPGLVV
jgi:probable F420-dependent oxidoreductase